MGQIGTKASVNPAIWNPKTGRADGRSENAVKGIGQKPVTLLALFREHNEEFKKRIGVDSIWAACGCRGWRVPPHLCWTAAMTGVHRYATRQSRSSG